MFDIGFWEIVFIAVIGLLVIGPDRLPEVARTVGQWVGRIQRLIQTVKTDIHHELENEYLKKTLDEQKEQINELKTIVDDTRSQFEQSSQSWLNDNRIMDGDDSIPAAVDVGAEQSNANNKDEKPKSLDSNTSGMS